jgi:hypothetical protein
VRKLCTFAGLLLTAGFAIPNPLAAQSGTRTQAPAIPRLYNGKPDFNGVWERPYVPDMEKDGRGQKGAGPLPFTPEYAKIFKEYDPSNFDYTGHCLPQGTTRSMNSPFPIRLVQTNDILAILYEAWNVFEIVHLDGKTRANNPDPLWFGHPVGSWDGDTLVIDNSGFNDKTNLDTVGHPHSEALHTVERFTHADGQHIQYEITVEDPKAFTRPWKNVRTFTLRPDWEVMEYSCEENNKDLSGGHIK